MLNRRGCKPPPLDSPYGNLAVYLDLLATSFTYLLNTGLRMIYANAILLILNNLQQTSASIDPLIH